MRSPRIKPRPILLPCMRIGKTVFTLKKEQWIRKNDIVNIFSGRDQIQGDGRKYDTGTQSCCPGTKLSHGKGDPNGLHQCMLAPMWWRKRPSPCRVQGHTNTENGTMARRHVQKIYMGGTRVFSTGMSKDMKQNFKFVNIAGTSFVDVTNNILAQ
jgi:hypothetical protein